MVTPMMKCGHAANAHDKNKNPVCIICSMGVNGEAARTVDDAPPSLDGRRARCSYYGRSDIVDLKRRFKFGCNYDCDATIKAGGRNCKCERPSSPELPFFSHKPDKQFDEFYCGCWGWD